MPKKWRMLVYGLPGSGKSTFALQLANSFHGRVLVVSVEEGFGASFREKLINWEIVGKEIFVSDAQSIREIKMDVKEVKPSLLVIDSISAGNDDLIDTNLELCQLWVCHSTKGGKYKGDSGLGHVVDIVVEVERGKAVVGKNRFGQSGLSKIIFS